MRDTAANDFHPPCKRALQLLSAVEIQIKLYPAQNFPKFIKILCEEECYYLLAKSLCPKLGKCMRTPDFSSKNCYHHYIAEKYIREAEIPTSDTSIDPQPQGMCIQ